MIVRHTVYGSQSIVPSNPAADRPRVYRNEVHPFRDKRAIMKIVNRLTYVQYLIFEFTTVSRDYNPSFDG